jgi:hypothetical protein
MSKPVAAGLFLLGLATIGVAASQDEQDRKLTAVVVDGDEQPPGDPETKSSTAESGVVEIQIGNDGNAIFINQPEKKEGEAGEDVEVVIQNEDGKIVRKIRSRPQAIRATGRMLFQALAIDPETRQAVEKMIAGLEDEAKRLEGDGKNDDAAKKRQSARALQQLLNPGPQPGGGRFFVRTAENDQTQQALKKLHDQAQALAAQLGKVPESDKEARVRLEQEMAQVKKQISDIHDKMSNFARFGGMPNFAPGFPGAPGALMPAPGQPINVPPPGWAGASGGWFAHSPSRAADEMSRKAMALEQAAARLKEAGLEQQARELSEQAQKLNAEAEKLRAQAAPHGFAAGGGFGPPVQLHQAIHELQEQVQQLRKEVGELRELLQRRQ